MIMMIQSVNQDELCPIHRGICDLILLARSFLDRGVIPFGFLTVFAHRVLIFQMEAL